MPPPFPPLGPWIRESWLSEEGPHHEMLIQIMSRLCTALSPSWPCNWSPKGHFILLPSQRLQDRGTFVRSVTFMSKDLWLHPFCCEVSALVRSDAPWDMMRAEPSFCASVDGGDGESALSASFPATCALEHGNSPVQSPAAR